MNNPNQSRNRIEVLLVLLATGLFAADLCFVPPSVMEGCDYLLMWKPVWHFLSNALGHGTIPLWNPYIDLGRPFLADVQNAVFYPPLYLIFLGQTAGVFLLMWLHCAIAAFGMRRLGEALQVGRWQSYFMAVCLAGSGAMTARWMTGQFPYCWALCYTPWLFYFAARTNEPWSSRRVAGHALALALQFLCGNPQVFWFSTIGQGIFILGKSARFSLRDAARELQRGICQYGVALVWCAGLVAAVLLPFVELVGQGNRNAPTQAFVNFVSLEWANLWSLVFPVGTAPQYAAYTWETNLFVGVIVVVMGLAGLRFTREPNVRGLLALIVAGLLLALGDNTPAFQLFYWWLPGFASLRCHAREGFLVVFALICASGIWLSRPHPKLGTFVSGNIDLPIRYWRTGLVALQTIYLLYATQVIKTTYRYANIFQSAPDFPSERALVKHLRESGLLERGQPPPRVFVSGNLVPANDAMMYRYSNVDGNFSLFLHRDWDYLHRFLGLQPPELINTSLSPEVYKRGPFPYPDMALTVGFDPAKGTFCVVKETSRRAFMVYAAEVNSNYDAILNQLENGYDIHQSALLEKPLAISLPKEKGGADAVASIRRFELDSILVDVDAKADGLLVLAEAWYPGWRAEIDGHVCDCVPANIWMRAAPVPAGHHEVRFYFHQDYLAAGLVISAMSGVLLLAVLKQGRTGHNSADTAGSPDPRIQ